MKVLVIEESGTTIFWSLYPNVFTINCSNTVRKIPKRSKSPRDCFEHFLCWLWHYQNNECIKRWGYVRDYYIKRRGKPGTGSSGEAAKKRSEQLSFLDSISSGKRSTLSNIEQSESQESVENSTAHCSKQGNNIEQQQSELLQTTLAAIFQIFKKPELKLKKLQELPNVNVQLHPHLLMNV
ncbi:hypothetical protein JTB14_019881 [Gonioctena quinquepunctata]|nr:hypothetical protein JTB14_019881 [Gonioctena quinquepunctata]